MSVMESLKEWEVAISKNDDAFQQLLRHYYLYSKSSALAVC